MLLSLTNIVPHHQEQTKSRRLRSALSDANAHQDAAARERVTEVSSTL